MGLLRNVSSRVALIFFIAHNASGFTTFTGSVRNDVDFREVGRGFVGKIVTDYVYVDREGRTVLQTSECTGVLVAPDIVLTCAHCLQPPASVQPLGNVKRSSTYFIESMGLVDHVHEDYDERLEDADHMHKVPGIDLAPLMAKYIENSFVQEAKTGKGFLTEADLLAHSIYKIDLKNTLGKGWLGADSQAATDVALVPLVRSVPNFQDRIVIE